ncbi:MAG: CUB domain-containing protein [Bacteroidota bacterium]
MKVLYALILNLLLLCLALVGYGQNFNMGNLGTINNACGGTFYDAGGPGSNYTSNQNFTATFCAPPGQYISFDFTQFSTELNYDYLDIYNGASTASTLIGSYSGNNGPGTVTSTIGGCLTFEFSSDGIFNYSGWVASITCSTTPPSTGNDCSSASPFCTGAVYTFPNNTGVASLGTINCLITTPNPVWYYMQIQNGGNLDINIAQTNGGGNGIDVDFNLWGPFTSLSAGCAAIAAGTAPNVDCSYSPSATEQANIVGALPGQFYIMLLTNYSNQAGEITFTNTAGSTAITNCAILCTINDVTANAGACNPATNTYDLSGQITVTNPPTTGTLTITNSCGGTVTLNPPFSSPINYSLSGLPTTGGACNVTASFSADATCSFTQSYTSPASCGSTGLNCPQYASVSSSPNVTCGGQVYYLEVLNTACNGTVSFNVVGNWGSTYANELTWQVTSNLTGAIVASDLVPGNNIDGGSFNVTVGPLNPAVVGNIFTFTVFDSFGDGFNGVGGFISIQQPVGTNIVGPITGNFGVSNATIFGANIAISPATITVTTPTGPVVATVNNCNKFKIPLTFQNTNYCSTSSVSVPWVITCQATGAVISSGTTNLTVYPNLPSSISDVVTIDFNEATCVWDVTPLNGCAMADLGTIFTISPLPSSLPPPLNCGSGGQTFQLTYNGLPGSPNCCSTGGPQVPNVYNQTFPQASVVPGISPFYNLSNHAAVLTVPPFNTGGSATSLTFTVNVNNYCFNQPGPNIPATTQYWITIIVDGQIVYDQVTVNPGPTNTSVSINLATIPGGYTENSTIQVYVYPNSFSLGATNTVYNPVLNCPIPNAQDGAWDANITATINAVFSQLAPTNGICNFSSFLTNGCCPPNSVPNTSATICSGESLSALTNWQNAVNNANTSCVVFSSILPVAGSVMPDNQFPNGINISNAQIQQSVSAYAYCDSDGSGDINAGDTYTLISTFVLTVNPSQTPTFNPVGPYCSGSVIPALPTISNEGITGTWSPVINNTATTVYTFTPTVGQCASVANTTIIINPLPLVSVSPSSDNICDGDILTLTANGADSIYSWSPNINISSTTSNPVNVNPSVNTTYTVIGTDVNGCTGQASAVITVSPIVTPIFPPIPALCVNDTPPLLPTTSINGITGTWSPSTINTSASGTTTYIFTPDDPNQCGETITTSVTIDPLPFTTPIFHD